MHQPYFDITTSAITTPRKHCTEFVPFVTAQYITVKLTAAVTKVFVACFLTLHHLQYSLKAFKMQIIAADSLCSHAHYNTIKATATFSCDPELARFSFCGAQVWCLKGLLQPAGDICRKLRDGKGGTLYVVFVSCAGIPAKDQV